MTTFTTKMYLTGTNLERAQDSCRQTYRYVKEVLNDFDKNTIDKDEAKQELSCFVSQNKSAIAFIKRYDDKNYTNYGGLSLSCFKDRLKEFGFDIENNQ